MPDLNTRDPQLKIENVQKNGEKEFRKLINQKRLSLQIRSP